jgi:hypothetical protein
MLVRMKMKISISFAWYDLWIGVYIDRKNGAIYVCPLPMLLIKFWREPKSIPEPEIKYTVIQRPQPTSEPKFEVGEIVYLLLPHSAVKVRIASVIPSRDSFTFFGWYYKFEPPRDFLSYSEDQLMKLDSSA